ncbi:unnamed protein product [Pleuronectes platessa]|uniref:Uncharacterized protein n=1 Tax=Pleuronectes platessa TaxID=8262 RepID=A0A9N7ZB94_PLEPL|nr:unnamed protein product [Pleuronectes platessa]
MADSDEAEAGQDPESPEDEEQLLHHFNAYTESRRANPWEQWTFREKANYYIDRTFLVMLVIFLFMVVAEFGYKMWYVMNVAKSVEFVTESLVSVFESLFTQERPEERAEL